MILRGRLSGVQRMRLGGLLDMLYKPSELAQEIGFSVRQVYRVYIPLGCPCERVAGRLWINGKSFLEWYEITYPRQSLKENQAFCLTCKMPVSMLDAKRKNKGRLCYWVCNCPHCGRKISRIIERVKI